MVLRSNAVRIIAHRHKLFDSRVLVSNIADDIVKQQANSVQLWRA